MPLNNLKKGFNTQCKTNLLSPNETYYFVLLILHSQLNYHTLPVTPFNETIHCFSIFIMELFILLVLQKLINFRNYNNQKVKIEFIKNEK